MKEARVVPGRTVTWDVKVPSAFSGSWAGAQVAVQVRVRRKIMVGRLFMGVLIQ
jgi:hypothetical protein